MKIKKLPLLIIASALFVLSSCSNLFDSSDKETQSVSCTIDLSQLGFNNSRAASSETVTVSLKLLNATDNSVIQSKTVTGESTDSVTISFEDVSIGKRVTISGSAVWADKYYATIESTTFSVKASNNVTVSAKLHAFQSFTYTYDGSSYTITPSYAGTLQTPITATAFTSTYDSNGQLYLFYVVTSSNSKKTAYIYTNGTTYKCSIDSYFISDATNSIICMTVLNDNTLLVYINTAIFKLTLSTDNSYTCIAITGTYSYTSMTSYYDSTTSTQYVLYGYTNSITDGPNIPALGFAKYADSTLTDVWTDATISLTDEGVFSSGVRINDMYITSNAEVYALLSDTKDVVFKSSSTYFNARGGLLDIGPVSSLVASTTTPTLSLIKSYGWRSSAKATYDLSISGLSGNYSTKFFSAISSSYSDDEYFSGPQRIIAVKPSEITIADYGIYPISSGIGKSYRRGNVSFDLSSTQLSFVDAASTDTSLYGDGTTGSLFTQSGY